MKRITTLLAAIISMAFMNQASATHAIVEVTTAGQLNSVVEVANCDSITISGNLNRNDFDFIRTQMPNLVYLNLRKVTVPENKLPNSGLYEMKSLKEVMLPDNLETIGNSAFIYCSNLKDISFPETLVTIEYNAFYHSGLSEVTFPANLQTISDAAFYECYDLKKVTFPKKLRVIGNNAFLRSNLSEVILPDSLKTIGNYAFCYCQQLQKVVFPEKLERMGEYAFYDCFRLHTATLKGKTAPSIAGNTFNYTKVFYVPEGAAQTYKDASYWSNQVIIDGNTPKKVTVTLATAGTLGEEILKQVEYVKQVNELVINGPLNNDDFYQIQQQATNLITIDLTGATIETLPEKFFYERAALLDIKLPATLKSIGRYAFYQCYGLTRISIPEGVTSIGEYAFYRCLSMQEITLPGTLTEMQNSIFEECSSLANIEFPDKITNIESRMCHNCSALKQVKFPTNLKNISNSAFEKCTALEKVVLPEGLTNIDYHAFYQCSALKEISFPSTLTTLGDAVFYRCTSLTEIALPASLTYCYYPFYECYNIKKVTSLASVPPSLHDNQDILYNVDKSHAELIVPFWSVNSYKLAPGWDAFPIISSLDYETDIINVQGELVIAADIRFKNNPTVSVFDNGQLTVRGTDALSMKKYTQSHTLSGYDDNNWSYRNPVYTNLLSESGAMRADSVIYKLNLKREYWQFITLPFDVNRADMQVDNNALFVIRYYDGKARANGETGNWKDVPADGTLQAGTGYIIQANKQTQLTLKAINNDNKNRLFSGNALKRTLNEYASEFAHNASWNFIGNPYPCFYDIYYMDYTSPITIWDTRNRTYTAVSTEDDNYILSPMQAFFIQKPVEMKEISFSAEGRQLNATVRQRTTTRSTVSPNRTVFNFTLNDDTYTDRTRVVINPEASMDYEMSRDAAKFMSDDKDVPQLFTLDATGRYYAINERPLSNGTVSVGIYAGKAGTYTLSLADATVTADEVILTDKLTGSKTRLDLDSYTFTTEAGFCTDRFELRLTTRTITGVEETQDTNTAQVTAGAGQILISAQPGDEKRLCNVTGQVIEHRILTQSSISLPVAPGFYIVTIGKETFKIMVTK